MYIWAALKDNEISKDMVDNIEPCLNPEFPKEQLEKLPCSENLSISSWSYDMEGHAKKCVERYCALANKTTHQLYTKYQSTPCIDDHHFKEDLKSVGELSKVCSQIVLKCLYLARIGRPDILWSVNKLARSMKKWTKACDKRLSRLISYIHYTCDYKQYCYVGNTAKQCMLGLFQDSDFAEILVTQTSTSSGTLCVFWKSCICSDMLDVQETNFSFAQFNRITNMDARLMLDGIPALDFLGSNRRSSWKRLKRNKARFRPVYEQTSSSFATSHNSKTKTIKRNDQWFGQCWFLFPQTSTLLIRKLCCTCLWRETKQWSRWSLNRRSPTTRHVSKTHRVALDWLFDRINVDQWSKLKIQTPETNSQKCYPREISHVTSGIIFCVLFIISHFSSAECSEVMSRRTTKRIRWRKSRTEVKTHDEFDCAKQRKGSISSIIFIIRRPRGKPDKKVKVLWVRKLKCTIERRNPMFAVTSVTRKVQETSRSHEIETRSLINEEAGWTMNRTGDAPLSAVTQVTSQITSNQCWTTWTWTSEYLDCHILVVKQADNYRV